jgi:hypothetical protein
VSTFLYRSAETNFTIGEWSWVDLPVHAAFLSANYTPDDSHATLEDIPSNAVILRDLEMTRLRYVEQLAKGVLPEVPSFQDSREVFALLLYTLGDTDAESELIYYSSDGTGFPWTPQGFDYGVAYRQENGGFFGPAEIPRDTEDFDFRVTEGGDDRILENSGFAAFPPVLLADLGSAKPRIYEPKENLVVRGQE